MIRNIFSMAYKGATPTVHQAVMLIADKGMDSDYHADGSDKQLSIITKELYDSFDKDNGLCARKYKPNIVVEHALQEGYYIIGEAQIYVKPHQKRCFEECLKSDKTNCLMKTSIYDGKVIKSGIIQIGDEIINNSKDV